MPLAQRISRMRVFVFDFDGTLVDSNPIKWAAFESCFSEFPDRREEIQRYCRENSHTTRWEKFRHIYELILGRDYTPEIEAALTKRFEEATTLQIVQTPSLPGAESFLLRCRREGKKICLLSSTPDRILREILRGRDWLGAFDVIQGAPVDKARWLSQLMERDSLEKDEIIFFGDTPEDAGSALRAGCGFVAIGEGKGIPKGVHRMADFRGLLS